MSKGDDEKVTNFQADWAKGDVLTMVPGQLLKLRDDTIVELVENPRDGMWVMAKDPDDPDGELDAVFVHDIMAVLPAREANK